MNPLELLLRVAVYLLSCYSLGLGSWALAELALPAATRVGLRLLAILAGFLVLVSVLVQALGLLGQLRAPFYLAASLLPGLLASWWWARARGRQASPHQAFFRLLRRGFRLWIAAPAWGLGWLFALCLLYLANRYYFLPQDIDGLSIHGPMIVDWIQQGRISLASHWNYPQCWEYQYVPGFLLLQADLLVVVPAGLVVAALLLAVRELAARLRLGGGAAQLIAFACATPPILYRDPLKSDPVFALSLLLGVVAIDRAARGRRGSFWLIQLAVFLVLGTKPSGFFYAAAFFGLYFPLVWLRELAADPASRARRLGLMLGATVLIQASAVAVQARNLVVNNNPIYPVRFQFLGRVIWPGPGDVTGTSILEHLHQADTWRLLVVGGGRSSGIEWPVLLLLLAVATGRAMVLLGRALAARKKPGSAAAFEQALPLVACFLWLVFTATPWSRGIQADVADYLASGNSWRYGLAPLCLTYLVAAATLRHFLPGCWRRPKALAIGLFLVLPPLVYWKWNFLGLLGDGRLFVVKLLVLWLVLCGLGSIAARLKLGAGRPSRLPRWTLPAAAAAVLLLMVVYARRVEATRQEIWAGAYRELWLPVWRELPAGSRIGISQPRARYRYVFYGPRLDNRILLIHIGKGQRGEIPDDLRFFYVVAPAGEEQLQRLIAAMETRGWQLRAIPTDRRGALMERKPG